MTEKVSIIIPCKNEKKYISQCIHSLEQNDYPSKEIIVVDGLSDDGTRDILDTLTEEYPNIVLRDNSNQITPVAMNIGIDSATGDYIMIAGAHSSYPASYISVLVKALEEMPEAVGVGGVMKTETDGSDLSESIAKVLSDRFGVGNSAFRIGAPEPVEVDTLPFGLYYRDVFEKAGKYNENLCRNQDIEWSKRVTRHAGKLFLIPTVYCTYYLRGNYKYLSRSNFSNGHWNILTVYITKNISSLSVRHFIPLAFLVGLIIPIALSFFFGSDIALLTAALLLIYAIFILFRSYRLAEKKRNLLKIFLSYPILHFSYGMGSLTGLFRLDKLIR